MNKIKLIIAIHILIKNLHLRRLKKRRNLLTAARQRHLLQVFLLLLKIISAQKAILLPAHQKSFIISDRLMMQLLLKRWTRQA